MAISRSLMNRQLQANGGIMQVAPREKFGAGTDTIRDYALGMNSGNGPITRKDYIDIYLFAGYDSDVASSLGNKHYKSGIGQDSNTQGFAAGGVVSREKFGLGSKLKSFVRKIIPNEVAEVATTVAPFVAPFNPAVAAAMSGIGTFDQTGSIGDSLKGGALTYGLGQGARYLGGAGFQDPSLSAFTPSGFTQGFSSPLGTDTGLGKFFSNRGTEGVQGINVDSGRGGDSVSALSRSSANAPGAEALASEVSYQAPVVTGSGNNPFGYKDAVTESVSQSIIDPTGAAGKSRALGDTILKTTVDKSVVAKEPGFLKNIFDGVSNQDYQKVAKTIGDGAKKFGKAMFTDKDGDIDKAAVMGALAFTASYAEARALAAEIGVDDDLTEAEYDELTKADKKAEYASYLTNFFGGVKDGGRIGFRDGTPDKIMEQFYESNDPDANKSTYTMEDFDITREPEVVLVSLQGPDGIKLEKMLKSDAIKYGLNIVADSIPPGLEGETIDLSVLGKKDGGRIGFSQGADQKLIDLAEYYMERDLSESEAYEKAAKELYKADGGRIGLKFGSEPQDAEVGIMTIDVEAGDDEDEENMKTAYFPGDVFSKAEITRLFSDKSLTTNTDRKQLFKILMNPGQFPEAEEMLIKLLRGKKDGGRIMFADGTPDKELEKILATSSIISDNPNDPRNMTTDQIIAIIQTGRSTPEMFEELMLRGYTGVDSLMVDEIGGKTLDKPQQVYSFNPAGERGGIMENFLFDLRENNPESYGEYNRPQKFEGKAYMEPVFKANGGRIKYAKGANRVSELLILRDEKIGKGEDTSDIDAEIFQLTGKVFNSVGGLSEIPTGQIRKNNAGVIERDYRDEGGFVPVGIKERADDVPAMLSKNEFVMTADAVRGIGNGSVEEGSKKLYKTMKQAEKVGKA